MANYELNRVKGTNVLLPKDNFITDEYADEHFELYLREHLYKNANGNISAHYRLKAMKPHSIEMALAYDINCPKCGYRLKQIERCRNSHELGLYTCPACDKAKGVNKNAW